MDKMTVLDGSFEEQVATLKKFFALSPDQSFQDLQVDEEDDENDNDD